MKHGLIQVKYRNKLEGFVDDVTLNELIMSRKINHFYRPSQEKWIDIETDPVRIRDSQYGGPERREPDEEEEAKQIEEKPYGLLSKLLRRTGKPLAPKKVLTADDWLVRGYMALYNEDDSKRALRAFAKSIHLEPNYLGAYFNRGITYERVGNFQQAIDDYSKAIELAPGDAMVYYLRGLARKRLGMDSEAIEDLEKAARMGYRQADVTAVRPAREGIPSSLFPRTEKPERHEVVTLLRQSEKPYETPKAEQPKDNAIDEVLETARDDRFIAYDNGTVLDTQTNLMWSSRDNGRDINWHDAKRYCENYHGGGYTDWRMPTQDELAGLYDAGNSYQATQCTYNLHLTTLIQLSACCPWASETHGAVAGRFETLNSVAATFSFTDGKRYWGLQFQPTHYRALPVHFVK